MTKDWWFISISLVIVIACGVVCFRSFKNLFQSIFWMLFPDSVSLWSKKLWKEDFENTFRFEVFALIVAALLGINYLIFRFII